MIFQPIYSQELGGRPNPDRFYHQPQHGGDGLYAYTGSLISDRVERK